MSHPLAPAAEAAGLRIPYLLATPAQQALALTSLRQRLAFLFPAVQDSTWQQGLIALQPDLWLTGPQVALAEADLRQLVHYLAASPELPLPAPSVFGLAVPSLAEYTLRTRALAAWVLPELVASAIPCGPRLYALICQLVQPDSLAEQAVQAFGWNLPGASPQSVTQWLAQFKSTLAESAAATSFAQTAGAPTSPSQSGKARGTVQPPLDRPAGLPQPPSPTTLHQTALFPSAAPQNAPELLDRRTQRDYSENFKMAVVWDVGRGERTPSQARLHYGVQGSSTVLEWCRKYAAHFQAAQLARAADSAAATTVKPAMHTTLKQQLQQLKQQLSARHHLSADEVKDRQNLNLLLRTLQEAGG